MCCEQEMEDIKKEMKELEAKSGSMNEEAYAMASKQLLMKLYRATGPAKVAAAKDHITMLLEQGTHALSTVAIRARSSLSPFIDSPCMQYRCGRVARTCLTRPDACGSLFMQQWFRSVSARHLS